MSPKSNEIKTMKIFPKGQIVIPVSLRKKYNIAIGDHVQVIPSKNGIFLKPSPKAKKTATLTDSLFGIFGEYVRGKKNADKKDIIRATEKGFTKGWRE
jgi:AbrB family looped-hinge helix DNA binding protein